MLEIPLDPNDAIPRYPVSELYEDTEDLWFAIGMIEVKGRVRFTNSGKVRFRRYVDRRHTEDLPKHATPQLWRPANAETWPYQLPEPVRATGYIQPEPPAASPAMPARHLGRGDFWPHAHVRLGRPGEAPGSPDEAEARYLRAVRTHWLMTKERTIQQCVWPKPLLIAAENARQLLELADKTQVDAKTRKKRDRLLLAMRPDDHDDFFIERYVVNDTPTPFQPTPRDVSEWELGLWSKWTPKTDGGLLGSQARMPPLSFYELAERIGTTVEALERRYEAAKQELWERARKA